MMCPKGKNVKNMPSGRVYLFTGILVCGCCGKRYASGNSYYTTKSGEKKSKPRYRCQRRTVDRTCEGGIIISERRIEKYLFEHIVEELEKYEREHKLEVAQKKNTRNTEKLIKETRKKMTRLKELYMEESIDMDEYKRDYNELKARLEELQNEEEQSEQTVDVEAIKSLLSQPIEKLYQTLTADQRRTFWRGFIDKLVVHDRDNIEIFFKC